MEELLAVPRHVGHLVIEGWVRRNRSSSFEWRARLLDLESKHGTRDVIPPLYNPRVVKMPDRQDVQMTLYGYERPLEGESVVAYAQYWVLLPLPWEQGGEEQNPLGGKRRTHRFWRL